MPTQAASASLAVGRLIQVVDDGHAADSLFKLSAALRKIADDAVGALTTSDAATAEAEGGRAGASATVRAALTTLTRLLRTAYTGVSALPSADLLPGGITEAQRLEVFKTYGWDQGELGRFPDSRVRTLAELAVRGGAAVSNAAWAYAPALVAAVQAQIKVLDENEPEATGGGRQETVKEREEDQEELDSAIARVRFHYCSASRDLDKTRELARIGLQPRREAGTVERAAAGGTSASGTPGAPA